MRFALALLLTLALGSAAQAGCPNGRCGRAPGLFARATFRPQARIAPIRSVGAASVRVAVRAPVAAARVTVRVATAPVRFHAWRKSIRQSRRAARRGCH